MEVNIYSINTYGLFCFATINVNEYFSTNVWDKQDYKSCSYHHIGHSCQKKQPYKPERVELLCNNVFGQETKVIKNLLPTSCSIAAKNNIRTIFIISNILLLVLLLIEFCAIFNLTNLQVNSTVGHGWEYIDI